MQAVVQLVVVKRSVLCPTATVNYSYKRTSLRFLDLLMILMDCPIADAHTRMLQYATLLGDRATPVFTTSYNCISSLEKKLEDGGEKLRAREALPLDALYASDDRVWPTFASFEAYQKRTPALR